MNLPISRLKDSLAQIAEWTSSQEGVKPEVRYYISALTLSDKELLTAVAALVRDRPKKFLKCLGLLK